MIKDKLKDFGVVTSSKSYTHTFKGDTPIVECKGSCHCISARAEGGSVVVKFRPDPLPYHLREKGYYETSKYVNVLYANGMRDLLIVKGKVER